MSKCKYSYSRLSTYSQCPRKHYYTYVEEVEVNDSPSTIPGSLFHKCCEIYLKTGDATSPEIQECFDKFDELCSNGTLELDMGLLKSLFTNYLSYYKKEFDEEKTLLVEYEFEEVLNPDDEVQDTFKGIIDEVYQKKDFTVVRDRKTSLGKLKYTPDKVKYNQQLLLYVPFVEDKLGLPVDAIEIDEVRFAKLQSVPLVKGGVPTKDKGKLELVSYESYYAKLKEMSLEDETEYKYVLDYLKKRGHPLFNRVRIQLLDERVIDSNAQDIMDMYKCIKTNQDNKYRSRSILCDYCPYKELCTMDIYNADDDIRATVLEKLKNN